MTPWETLRRLGETPPDPRPLAERQLAWLQACLQRNAACAYGRRQGFADIRSVQDYQSRLPLIRHEDIATEVAAMAAGQGDRLFTGHPLAFERTSGSSGGSGGKLIPYSRESLADFRRAVLPWLARSSRAYGLEAGCAYWSISPATRVAELTPSGIAVGLPDGAYLGPEALPAFAALSAVPPEVGGVTDVAEWRLLTLASLIRRADLALISVWSPTFFLTLLEAIDNQADVLHHRLASDAPARERLGRFLQDHDTRHLWPALKLVSTWGDASSAPYLEALGRRLPQAAIQPKGLLSTEGVVSIPFEAEGAAVLAADCGFHEFLDVEGNACLAHQLDPGQRYEVVLTTAGGLYRYQTGDEVLCTGHAGDLPRLTFLGRIGLVSDLVGEKLTDAFVAQALAPIPGFRMLAAEAAPAGYVLILETTRAADAQAWAAQVDQALHANPHYAYARRLGQLAPLRPVSCPDALERHTRHALARGARLGDVKIPNLMPEPDALNLFLEP